jgi:hypothetical protein
MNKVYLGSPLFSASEQFWNEVVADELKKAGFEVFNPQSDNTANDKDNPNVEVSAKSIFAGDTKEVISANYMVANIDGLSIDSGLAAECGIFWAMKKNAEGLGSNHYKGIVGYRSDIRKYGEGDQRFYFNQYVVGLIEDIGVMVDINPPNDKLDIDAYRTEARKIVKALIDMK